MSKQVVTIAALCAPLCAALAGCGGSGGATSTSSVATSTSSSSTAPATTTTAAPITVTVFRVRNGRLYADVAHVPETRAVASASLTALDLPAHVTIAGGTAQVDRADATREEVAEIVYTLTQYTSVQRVDVAGKTGLTRADISSFVPPILVERPAAGAVVGTTIPVSGSASVYEATVVLELRQDGKLVQKKVVTAAEGAPGRGPFSGTLVAPDAGHYVVAAYSPSAVDGSPQHEQDVPVAVTP